MKTGWIAVAAWVGTVSCQQAGSRASSASVSELCLLASAEFRIPPDPGGPPEENQNSEQSLARDLSSPDVQARAMASMKLLRHPERRITAVLELAVRTSGSLGDYRILNNLERIATQHAVSDEGDELLVAYPLSPRISASAAIGRIIEMDRSAPPGVGTDETGGAISDEDVSRAVLALTIAACPSEPAELRAAAIEALGLLRTAEAKDFLEATLNDPELPGDEVRALLLRGLSAKSLSTITHNNHLIDTGLAAEIREVIQAYNESGAGGTP